MSTLDYHRMRRFINTFVSSAGLNYNESEHNMVPKTDGRTIYMPSYNPLWSEKEANNWLFALVHECYHNLPDNRQDFTVAKDLKIGGGSKLHTAMNVVLDHNIECKEYGKLEGADLICRESYEKALPKMREFIEQDNGFPDDLKAIIALDQSIRSDWLGTTGLDWRESLPDDAKPLYDNILQYREEYATPRPGGMPNYDFVMKLLVEMGGDEDDLRQEAAEAYQSGEGEGEEGAEEGDGAPGRDGKGATGEAQDGDGTGGEDEEGRARAALARYKDITPHSHESGYKPSADLTLEYDEDDWYESTSHYTMDDPYLPPPDSSSNRVGDRLLSSTQFTLSNRVKNRLRVLSQVRWQGGKERGKIHKRALASIVAGNDRVFRQKAKKDILDTAVSVLVDNSGSMSGKRYEHAAKAALMLNDCLNQLNVPVEIIGFTSHGSKTLNMVHTTHAKRIENHNLAAQLGNMNEFSQNIDGESILYAHDRLIKHKARRKILIVLSDGQPAGKAGIAGFTKLVVEDIEKRSPVEIYGIGIQTNTTEEIYKRAKSIKNANQLEEALLYTVEDGILK